MTFSQQIHRENWPTLKLACPLVAGHLSHMLTALTDTVMVGQLGAVPLAAAALANTLMHLVIVFGFGMATAVAIQVSQARGAKDPAWARTSLLHGYFLGAGVGVVALLFGLLMLPLLPWLGQDPTVVEASPGYLLLIAVSIVPAVMGMMVKSHAEAMNRPWPPFWFIFGGALLNIFFNWLFIFGAMGFPAWGLEGAGVATLLSRFLVVAGLIYWCRVDKALREWVPQRWQWLPDWTELKALWKLGFPTSLQTVAQISALSASTLIIGSLGPEALAAHQVAIMCAATIFLVSMGLSQAVTVRIGENRGAGTFERIRPIVVSGWFIGLIVTIFSASSFLAFNQAIAQWFLPGSPAATVAASLLLVAAVFQLGDSMQIISVGALRGMSDVKFPAWISFLCSWFISLPSGWILAYPVGLGVIGVWWGFSFSLTVMAIALGIRAWSKSGVLSAFRESPLDLEAKVAVDV